MPARTPAGAKAADSAPVDDATDSPFPAPDSPLQLGTVDDEPLELPLKAMLRHAVILGSSGSGKTVGCKILVEEAALRGIPIIAIDPQGDIASLALAGNPKQVKSKGLDPELCKQFHDKVEVVIWSPASSIGVPICLSPLTFSFSEKPEARIHEISTAAKSITNLLGYDLSKSDGRLVGKMFDVVITYIVDQNWPPPQTFDEFADFLKHMPDSLSETAMELVKESQLEDVIRKVRALGIGADKLLFNHGLPLDIDTLLGREPRPAGHEEGAKKTRVSVIYLNTLTTQDQKDFFLAQLTLQLYRWMLDNPSKDVQALFYVDEVAPFLPPVRKPACKDALKLLYKQARKYGLGCLMATQNPGDIDYKAVSQFSTWVLGRMLTQQDIGKVEQIIKSLDPVGTPKIIARMPKLKPGNFLLLSPDNYDSTQDLQTRWLYTKHSTLDDDQIYDTVPDEHRAYFEARGLDLRRGQIDHAAGLTSRAEPVTGPSVPKLDPLTHESVTSEWSGDAEDDEAERKSDNLSISAARQRELEREQEEQDFLKHMRSLPEKHTPDTLAGDLGLSERRTRELIKILEERGQVRRFRIGNKHYFVASEFTWHPKLGVLESLPTAPIRVTEIEAHKVAKGMVEKEFFIIEREEVHNSRLVYLPLWRCNYEGKKGGLLALFSASKTKIDNIYIHPSRGEICMISGSGFEFISAPKHANPLDIKDLDDITDFEYGTARGIEFIDWTLDNLQTQDNVKRQFRRKFDISARRIDLVFIPIWEFILRDANSPTERRVYVDGVMGKPIDIGVTT